jgi:transposase InsO family protein
MTQRQQLIVLVDEAVAHGARQHSACKVLGLNERTVQRWRDAHTGGDRRGQTPRIPHNKLGMAQREAILEVINRPAYRDLPPSQIVPRLADEGRYLASESTLYRLLRDAKQLRHRHASKARQHTRPAPVVAKAANQVYSWDITYLPTLIKGVFFFLYVFIDLFSRKIVGWQVHDSELGDDAAALLKDICRREGITKNQVTLHSDNGSTMKGMSMLSMMQDLGIIPSFSRPGVSDDNPYSEAWFRTAKYAPFYPGRFATLAQARDYFERFVQWYNEVHYHSGINFVTPAQRHRSEDQAILAQRKRVYEQAKEQHPERWNGRATRKWDYIREMHLNPEKGKSQKPAMAEAA